MSGRFEQEGVIKFRLEREPGPAPRHPALPALMRLRNELFAHGLVGVDAGGVGYGNVSIRVGRSGSDPAVAFVISGTGTGEKAQLDSSGYCLVTACDAARNLVRCRGPVAASSESMTHGAVYAAGPAMGCALHVHSRRLFDLLLREGAPATPPDAAYGTPAMAEAVRARVRALPEGGIVVMAGHDGGILAFGPDAASARTILWFWLEQCARPDNQKKKAARERA